MKLKLKAMENKRNILPGIIIAIILSSALFSGCLTKKQADARCASRIKETDSTSVQIDSSRKETFHYDTIMLPYPVAGPVQYLPHPCAALCDSIGHLKPIHIKEYKNGITSTIDSKGDSLEFGCKEDSMRMVIEQQKIELTIMKQVYEEKIKQLLTVPKSNWQQWLETSYKYSAWLLWFSMLIIILFLIGYWYMHRTLPFRK